MTITLKPGQSSSWIWILILLIILLIIFYFFFLGQPSEPGDDPPAQAASASQYASGWTVKHPADWTPPPPNSNPLGPPNNACTGGTIKNSWAHFTFPAMSLPSGATVSGIEVRFKYLSASGTNTAQLTRSGSLIGSSKSVASVSGTSNCASTTFTTVGSDSDTWGSGATAAEFNAASIGVRLTQNANTVDLDAVELIVHYTP